MDDSARTVLITGAARGFGRACAEAFAVAGWNVVGAVRELPADAGADHSVVWVRWDVTDDDTGPLIHAMGGRALDLLVNNAGRGTPGTPLREVEVSTLLDVCDVNVGGVLRAARAMEDSLRAAPAPLIVNVSSRLGSAHDQAAGHHAGLSTSYAYRISKAAQNMATICLAAELAPTVRVWALHPGVLATSMGQHGASGDVRRAAAALLRLADDPDPTSPRYRSLDGDDLPW
jgi:NAD(P)-dependent dehydrogenase (short-subunit alcohol dehydrogenase family)